jgi:metal-sulfur cluster biosynthetic enzyme
MGEVLKADVQRKVLRLPGVTEAYLELIFGPPRDRNKMSEAAMHQLGML